MVSWFTACALVRIANEPLDRKKDSVTVSATYRMATPDDAPAILELIRELARYEHAEDEVEATPELLQASMFDDGAAEALLAVDEGGGVIGMALFFRNFSTWTGTAGMYLEDLVVTESARGGGVGRGLMARLARICKERGWKRLDWSCLDWNEPSLRFYQTLGAARMDEWIHHRVTGDALSALAALAGEGAAR